MLYFFCFFPPQRAWSFAIHEALVVAPLVLLPPCPPPVFFVVFCLIWLALLLTRLAIVRLYERCAWVPEHRRAHDVCEPDRFPPHTVCPGNGQRAVVLLSQGLNGLGFGMVLGALPALVAELSPRDQKGIATGIYNSLKTLGGAVGGAVFAVVLAATVQPGLGASLGAYRTVWVVGIAALAVSVVVLACMPSLRRSAGEGSRVEAVAEPEAAAPVVQAP